MELSIANIHRKTDPIMVTLTAADINVKFCVNHNVSYISGYPRGATRLELKIADSLTRVTRTERRELTTGGPGQTDNHTILQKKNNLPLSFGLLRAVYRRQHGWSTPWIPRVVLVHICTHVTWEWSETSLQPSERHRQQAYNYKHSPIADAVKSDGGTREGRSRPAPVGA